MRTWTALILLLGVVACSGCSKTRPTDKLVEDLKRPEERDRVAAVRLLPRNKGDAAKSIPALIEALKDPEPDVRRSAAIGLGSFGEQAKDAVPALQRTLRDGDIRVRNAARDALTRIDPSAAAKPDEKAAPKPDEKAPRP